MNDRTYEIKLTQTEIEWVMNRKKVLLFIKDDERMPYIYPDQCFAQKNNDSYLDGVQQKLIEMIQK